LSLLDFEGSGGLVGYLLPVYRELVPQTGWYWPMGRDAVFALVGRPTGNWEAWGKYRQIVDSGPLGHLAASLALMPFSPKVSKRLAGQAAKRVTSKDFHADYAPLLAGDSWLGRNILSLAEALRLLDPSEIEALVRLLPGEFDHDELARSLLVLKSNPRRPARDLLPVVFDRIWNTTMKPPVETALKSLAGGKLPQKPTIMRDVEFERTSGSN
jgi:hypothetical protein